MTITKINVSYGAAGLNIKLPSLSFSEHVYSTAYFVDGNDAGNINMSEDIKIDNVDPLYVQVNLTGKFNYNQ